MEIQLENFDIENNFVHEYKIHKDKRGYFFESLNPKILKKFSEIGINFIQMNISKSLSSNTFRGLHFQKKPYEQSKFVKVLNGSIMDYIVDIRPSSATYLDYAKIFLNDEDGKGILVPKGFAHGFQTLEHNTIVQYFVDQIYMPEYDSGIRYDDKKININFEKTSEKLILSDKDSKLKLVDE